MADELIDVYNENNEFLGIHKMKSAAHKDGLWHRASYIWIYNSNGEILIQLRAENKDLYPNLWDVSVAGHVGAGEDPIISAVREIKEEIGLSVTPEDLQFLKIRKHNAIYKQTKNNEFFYVYLLKFEGDIKKLTLQKEEVKKIKFVKPDKLEEELKIHSERYVPHLGYWSEMIDRIRCNI